jgi:porin
MQSTLFPLHRRPTRVAAALTLAMLLPAGGALADDGLWQRETLTGDWGGARTALKDKGVTVGIIYINETLAVLSGGLRREATYQGRLEVSVDTDLEKLMGWNGASTHIKGYQLHQSERNVGQNVGGISDVSNIDAVPATRLFTAWFQQTFLDDRLSIRAGKLAADDEFVTSASAATFINATFGWAPILGSNMRSGGPAFPLGAPGVRVQVNPTKEFAILGAVFAGDPAGRNCTVAAQVCNRHGTKFSFAGGALWMGELQYSINAGAHPAGLPGVYKIGFWHATADYADQRFGIDAGGAVVGLAFDPGARAIQHKGNGGIYGVADQMIWRGDARSVNLFMRAGVSPDDRNLLSFYVDGGVVMKGVLAGRPEDKLAFGVGYAEVSPNVSAFDRDTLSANGPPYPVRSNETVFELTYIAQVAPWWSIQPDLQYIVRPGGGVPGPNDPSRTVGNALVAGVRSVINF